MEDIILNFKQCWLCWVYIIIFFCYINSSSLVNIAPYSAIYLHFMDDFAQLSYTGMFKATLPFLQKMLLNKATCDCSFANSSPIFVIFGIVVNNDIVDRSHDFGCHGNHFGGKICFTIVTKMGILLHWISQAEYRVCNTVCQWCSRNFDIVYMKIIMGNSTVIIF